MNAEIFKRLQALFFERLEAKTGWGKEDVKKLYRECANEVLLEYIDKK